ncbi:MAG: CBS domain-containing protein [Planctomycetota bacterium]|jgi:CBS domain-containing protein
MLKAKDIMIQEVITVTKDTPIFHALELLAKHNITDIPVVEDDMILVGILSEKDILRLFYADEGQKNLTVNSFMRQPAVHFDENEALPDICDCLMNYFIRRVPVTSKGKVVGNISRGDIIEYVLRLWQANTVPAAGASK